MVHELQSKGIYIFTFFNNAGVERTQPFYRIDTVNMDKFINTCSMFDTTEKGGVVMEWETKKHHTILTIENQEDSKNGVKICGSVQNTRGGYLSSFKMDVKKFHEMEGAWFFSNGEERIRIFDDGTIWLDNKLGHFIVSPNK